MRLEQDDPVRECISVCERTDVTMVCEISATGREWERGAEPSEAACASESGGGAPARVRDRVQRGHVRSWHTVSVGYAGAGSWGTFFSRVLSDFFNTNTLTRAQFSLLGVFRPKQEP